MIGRTVGHYRIDRKLGAGGMGEVYLAHDTRLDRPVALKFIRTPGDPGGAQQLLREARAASALNHPSVCTLHEVGELGPDAYIVMEYVEGEALSERVAAGPIPFTTSSRSSPAPRSCSRAPARLRSPSSRSRWPSSSAESG